MDGKAQAAALEKAQIKVIANTGNVNSGISEFTDLFSSKGGSAIGNMIEGLANTEAGSALVEKFVTSKNETKTKLNGASKQ